MNQEIREILQEIYTGHNLKETDLDYTIANKYKDDLNRLSELNNCCFFIVDLHKFEYIFTSDNFKNIVGYVPTKDDFRNPSDNRFLDSRIHSDDFLKYKEIQLKVGEFIMQQPKDERINYKHIFELRVQNIQGNYVRLSWERQALETDKLGNLWLMLGIINILSDQINTDDFKSFFINLKTGERIDFISSGEITIELTSREKEILQLIQKGLLSKEIADQLAISINTVNIHRQNILHKMNADNSFEAVNRARILGILK
ncbi:helix-turn-helix transcriptional regulator [Dysgonomonas sp. ZJ279]|uniref:helix-turn-helix transcriptional regulator n=1 Tax=Dysgonomonas sp. ZJ279 TaxID=2709796 RepID=UPI0013EC1606|nr:LuxR C-terminal-related transcriptional regulator [Dysgonomonas sp. ZJ279]